MSVVGKALSKVAEGRRIAKEKASSARRKLVDLIIKNVEKPDAKSDTDADAIARVIEEEHCSEEEAIELHKAAADLHLLIQEGELPPADEVAALKALEETRDKARKMVEQSIKAYTEAQELNARRGAARQQAQRILLAYPCLRPMFNQCSWAPKLPKLESPQSPALVSERPATPHDLLSR